MQNLIITWISKKFNHPLVPLFFALGCILLLIGLTTGYKNVKIAGETELRYISIALGAVCLSISIILYYRPPKNLPSIAKFEEKQTLNSNRSTLNISGYLKKELNRSFSARKDRQIDEFKSLLGFIEAKTKFQDKIPQEDFDDNFPNYVFFMLEVLIWMGFIEKEDSGRRRYNKPLHNYWLSTEYKRELGR